MTRVRLPPYPCVTDDLRSKLESGLGFSCPDGPPPGEHRIDLQRYTFGKGTDWSIEQHPLRIECRLANPGMLAEVFGAKGLVCRNARLMIALEWVSSRSSRRGFSKPQLLDYREVSGRRELVFVLDFPARELAGGIQLSLELLVGAAGRPGKDERHLANAAGLRLGSLGEPWHLVFDGAGSLFPIVQRAHAPTDPLWNFIADWDDPAFDEFSVDFVCLEINTSHPDFGVLYGDAKSPYSTPLFRQVLASWLMLFLEELRDDAGAGPAAQVTDALRGRLTADGESAEEVLPGSIAHAAREFRLRGNLDTKSSAGLLYSAQRWVDERFTAGE